MISKKPIDQDIFCRRIEKQDVLETVPILKIGNDFPQKNVKITDFYSHQKRVMRK